MRKEYKPIPYHQTGLNGEHIKLQDRADNAARFLASEIWGDKQSNASDTLPKNKLIEKDLPYNTGPITASELQAVIKKFKRRKALGPDEVPMEILKEMDDTNLNKLVDVLNKWWISEDLPDDLCAAGGPNFQKGRHKEPAQLPTHILA